MTKVLPILNNISTIFSWSMGICSIGFLFSLLTQADTLDMLKAGMYFFALCFLISKLLYHLLIKIIIYRDLKITLQQIQTECLTLEKDVIHKDVNTFIQIMNDKFNHSLYQHKENQLVFLQDHMLITLTLDEKKLICYMKIDVYTDKSIFNLNEFTQEYTYDIS